MCGIAGIIALADGRPITRDELERMAASIRHRGPDSDGFHLEAGVGFAFRRLSIIDVDGSDQPIRSDDGRLTIIFNGEVYNFRALRDELFAKGHRFRTQGDGEVVLLGYREWGARGVCERLLGMYAFAIHDHDARRVVLARDRLGIKPLHLAEVCGRLLFASEPKAILAAGGLDKRVDPRALIDYATLGYVPAPRSIFAGVDKLPPGCFAVVDEGRVRTERYWRAPFEERPAGADEAAERILALLRDAVKIRLMSEVPLGAFLSGGVDSSAVVAAMVEELGTDINAVTVGFEEKEFDERQAAAITARHLGIEPLVEELKADVSALDAMCGFFDEPHADPSDVPTFLLCQATRRRVTVALSGDGGDELFGGYRRYAFDQLENRLRSFAPSGVRRAVFGPLGQVWPKADFLPRPLRAKTLLQNLAVDPISGYLRSVSRVLPAEVERMIEPDLLATAGGYRTVDHFRQIDDERDLTDPLHRIRAIDIETWLSDDILAKVDRASMAHSLEVRVPVLDHRMVEYATSLPSGLLIQKGAGKWIFKHALRQLLPDEVLFRRKHGFDLPVDTWLAGPLSAELDEMAAPGSPLDGYFDVARAGEMLREHRAGRRDRKSELWTLLLFARWRRGWLDG